LRPVAAGADGAELGDVFVAGLADGTAAFEAELVDEFGAVVAPESARACGLATNPASATATASAATSANGARSKSVPRLMVRIFVEPK
jgi:hypothetical protein